MIDSLLFLILAGGIPYFILLEPVKKISSRFIFIFSSLMLLGAIVLSWYVPNEHLMSTVLVAFASALYAIYKALQTTNFYKLGYYLIFVNAPFFMLFEEAGAMYSLALLVSLLGIYLIARFYEKNYASANYHYIRGITLSTPYIGTFLTVYLIALALYPPFPNALYFFNYILGAETSWIWYVVVVTLFFANFHLAIRVLKQSLFGQPNPNIHYVDLSVSEKALHFTVVLLLLVLSIYGLKEILL